MSQLICDSCGRLVPDAGVSNYGCAVFLGKEWCHGTMRKQRRIYASTGDFGILPREPYEPPRYEVMHSTIGGKGVVARIKR